MHWIIFIVGGFSAAALAVRFMMIDAGMVRDLLACDPTFEPAYHRNSLADRFDQEVRTRHSREYRRRFPDGPLNAKLRHTYWAMALWAVLVGAALLHWPVPRGR